MKQRINNTYIIGVKFVIVENRPVGMFLGGSKMDTKSLIVDMATKLFQKKGYKGVGLTEILKACNITKGGLYHHFPNGKEELLIACLQSLNEAITTDIELIFQQHPSTQEATQAIIEKLITDLETEGTITGYTFSSIVSEMATLSEPVRNACGALYEKIQDIFRAKLLTDGFSMESAASFSLFMNASIEGAMMLCLTQQSSDPLKTIRILLPNILKSYK